MDFGKIAILSFTGAFLLLGQGCCTSPADYSKELSEVKSGVRKEAKASWWGFNKEDSTKALQAAIDSGVKKLIVDNTGSDWVVDPIFLANGQEIVFEKDVVVIAKKGSFKNLTDCLFTAKLKKGIVLRGESGATLKMRKADYLNPAEYKHGEWRHAVSLIGCENVSISNLTIQSSGGDGIYIGRGGPDRCCKNVTIENVVCDDNNRQGVSVISVENLTIRDSVFKNTYGALPEGGIDFEPNSKDERLVNCLVENCKFIGNRTYGVVFCLNSSTPLSITVRNCDIKGNKIGLAYALSDKGDVVSGTVTVEDCRISKSPSSVIVEKASGGVFVMRNCVVDNSEGKRSAINVLERRDPVIPGRIVFEGVSVVDDSVVRPVFEYKSWVQRPKTVVEGVVDYSNKGVSSKVDCAKIRPPAMAAYDFTAAKLADLSKLSPQSGAASGEGTAFIPVRYDGAKFLQYAEAGRQMTVEVKGIKVGKINESKVTVCLKSPKGKELKRLELSPDGKYVPVSFTAVEAGLYSIECLKGHGNAFAVKANNRGGGYLMDGDFKISSPKGKLFFQAPAGVKDIKIEVLGDLNETVDVALLSPQGKVMDKLKGIEELRLLKCSRQDASKSEIWALELSNAVEDCAIRLGAPLVPVVSTSSGNLLLVQ